MDSGQGDTPAAEGRVQGYSSPSGDQQESVAFYHRETNPRESQQHDNSAATHQGSHPASVEELQLAAQLGQDLATEPMMPVPDPNTKFDEPSLRSIIPHPEEPSLHNAAPHAEEPTSRPYVSEESAGIDSVSAPVPISLDHHVVQFSHVHDESTPPRKRSKVSRACDECRRKKVRCDATSDLGDSPCSNCKRSSQRCSFSRIPQKRGPSKGYIKELADRINSIEGRLSDNPGTAEGNERRRALSSVSSADLHSPSVPRQQSSGWGEGRVSSTALPDQTQHIATYGMNGLAPQPVPLKPHIPSKQPTSGTDAVGMDLSGISQSRDVEDEVFLGYLSLVHPYLPILPSSKARLQTLLAQCPGMLREAFLEAFAGALFAFPSFAGLSTGDVELAKKMLLEWESSDDMPRSHAMHMVHLQTLILLVIEADLRPSVASGTQKGSLLGRAIGTAGAMRIYQARIESLPQSGHDYDSEAHIRIRLWWSLILLDRWNSVVTGTPTMTPKDSAVVDDGLGAVVGEVMLLLIRSSKILERVSVVITSLEEPTGPATTTYRILGGFLDDYVENFREDLPSHVEPLTYPVIHLTYWYSRLLAYLLDPSAKSRDVMWPCKELVALLVATPQMASPIHHHFMGLVVLSLAELSKLEKTKDEANKLLAELRTLPTPANTWNGAIGERLGEHFGQPASGRGLLQQLADVAASSSAVTPEAEKTDELPTHRTAASYQDMGFDPRPLLRAGFLKLLSTSHEHA